MAKVVPGRQYIMKKPQRLRNNTLKTDLGVGYTPKWQRIMHIYIYMYMGVFINGGPPKSMVDFMENPIEMDDLGVPPFQETSILRIT